MKETSSQKRARIIQEQLERERTQQGSQPASTGRSTAKARPRPFPRWPGAAGRPGARKPEAG